MERKGNANGTGRERELERFKNAFSAAFSVRFLLSGTVPTPLTQREGREGARIHNDSH